MQIKVNNLVKVFDPKSPSAFKALDLVSVAMEQGEMISIIGSTGSGKTTFIEHLNGLILPTTGTIDINGKFRSKVKKPNGKKRVEIVTMDVKLYKTKKKMKFIKELRRQIGVVFQFAEYQLFETTIKKEIMFGPVSMGVKKEKAAKLAEEYLEIVGLSKRFLDKSPFELSGGQKRRVALAGILAMEPDFLVLDEPTAGLDPQGALDVLKIFKKLNEKGKTIIIVTHNLDHALEYTRRTIFFNEGKIVKTGPTLEIMEDTEFLIKNHLEPPKLLHFAAKLKKKGVKIGAIRSIKGLALEIEKHLAKGEI